MSLKGRIRLSTHPHPPALLGYRAPWSTRRISSALLLITLCYRGEHQAHSFYKSKKVLDNTCAAVKSSVHVNGVSNRRGVWRVNYEYVVVFL